MRGQREIERTGWISVYVCVCDRREKHNGGEGKKIQVAYTLKLCKLVRTRQYNSGEKLLVVVGVAESFAFYSQSLFCICYTQP